LVNAAGKHDEIIARRKVIYPEAHTSIMNFIAVFDIYYFVQTLHRSAVCHVNLPYKPCRFTAVKKRYKRVRLKSKYISAAHRFLNKPAAVVITGTYYKKHHLLLAFEFRRSLLIKPAHRLMQRIFTHSFISCYNHPLLVHNRTL